MVLPVPQNPQKNCIKPCMNYILMFQTIDFSRYIFYKTSDIIRLYLNVFLITKVIDVHSRKYKELEKKNSNHF